MNTDIRLSVDFTTHHKTRKLRRKLGADAVLGLIDIFSYAAKVRPDGVLHGLDADDLEDIACWNGGAGELVAMFCEIGFLECDSDGIYTIHDWEEHNPWAAGAKERSDAASKAGKASAAKRAAKKEQQSQPDSNGTSTDGQRPVGSRCNGSATPSPSPSPFPSPEENTGEEPPIAPLEGGDVCGGPKAFSAFWAAYPKKTGKKAALTAWKKAKGKPPVEDMLAAIARQQEWPQWQRDGGQYIPNPATWLNQGRWSDEPPPIASRASPHSRPMTRDEQRRQHNDAVFRQLMEDDRGL